MSQPIPPDDLNARVRSMQTILGAIVLGAIVFLAIAVYLRSQGDPTVPEPPMLTYLSLGVGILLAVAFFFVTDYVAAAQRRKLARGVPEPQRAWYAAYGLQLIAGAALLELAAFVLILAYLAEGHWEKNKMAAWGAIAFIAFLVTLLPTRPRIESWIKEQQLKLKGEQAGRR